MSGLLNSLNLWLFCETLTVSNVFSSMSVNLGRGVEMKWEVKSFANFHNLWVCVCVWGGEGIIKCYWGWKLWKIQFDLPPTIGTKEYIIYLGDHEIIVECYCCFHYRFLLNLRNRSNKEISSIFRFPEIFMLLTALFCLCSNSFSCNDRGS